MEVKIEYTLLEKDFIEINKELHKIRTKKFKWLKIILISFLVLITINILIYNLFANNADTLWFEFSYIVFLELVFILLPLYRKYKYRKVFNSFKKPEKARSFILSDDFIRSKTEESEGTTTWNSFTEIIELKDWILLMTSKISFIPIPKLSLQKEEIGWLKSKKK